MSATRAKQRRQPFFASVGIGIFCLWTMTR